MERFDEAPKMGRGTTEMAPLKFKSGIAQKRQGEECTAHKVMGWMSLPRVEATPLLSRYREERFSLVTRATTLWPHCGVFTPGERLSADRFMPIKSRWRWASIW